MNLDIKLHKEDLPDEIEFSDKIAIDCEFTGLNIERDRLCLLQISSGKNDAHIMSQLADTYAHMNEISMAKLLFRKILKSGFSQCSCFWSTLVPNMIQHGLQYAAIKFADYIQL